MVTLDGGFYILGKVFIERCGGAMFSSKAKRLRKQPDVRFGGTHHSNGSRVVFDHHFVARPHARHKRLKIARSFSLRNADHMLGHAPIIHLEGPHFRSRPRYSFSTGHAECSSPSCTSKNPSDGSTSIGSPPCHSATPTVNFVIPFNSSTSRF